MKKIFKMDFFSYSVLYFVLISLGLGLGWHEIWEMIVYKKNWEMMKT